MHLLELSLHEINILWPFAISASRNIRKNEDELSRHSPLVWTGEQTAGICESHLDCRHVQQNSQFWSEDPLYVWQWHNQWPGIKDRHLLTSCQQSSSYAVALLHLHLADAFIQSNLHCIQSIHFILFFQYMCSLGIEPTTFCAANAMLYHWATGTLQ